MAKRGLWSYHFNRNEFFASFSSANRLEFSTKLGGGSGSAHIPFELDLPPPTRRRIYLSGHQAYKYIWRHPHDNRTIGVDASFTAQAPSLKTIVPETPGPIATTDLIFTPSLCRGGSVLAWSL
jgi:hypothetical protein